MRHKLGGGFAGCGIGAADAAEPVHNRWGIGLGIPLGPMGPVPLAGDDVVEAVAVDVGHIDRVDLRESDAVGTFREALAGDQLPLECAAAVVVEHLAIPGQAPAVGREARDHIVEAVAVDIADIHLRAPRARKLKGMPFPERIPLKRLRLLPPAALLQDVHAAIAIDVAHAEAVGELLGPDLGADAGEGPASARVASGNRGVAEAAADGAHNLWAAIAGDVDPLRRFVVDHIEGEMPQPVAGSGVGWPRVFQPPALLAGEAVDDNIAVAIAVDVVDKLKEAVGVAVGIKGRGFEELVPCGEVGPRIPERAGDDVGMAVAVEIASRSAFAEEAVAQPPRFKGDQFVGRRFVRSRQACRSQPSHQGNGWSDPSAVSCEHRSHPSTLPSNKDAGSPTSSD